VAAAFVSPLREHARAALVALNVGQIETLLCERLQHEVAERIAAEPRDPGDVDSEPGKRDREVRLGAGDSQRQRHPGVRRTVRHRVEEDHRLADGEDAHPSGGRYEVG
jgi:hypothetical protein